MSKNTRARTHRITAARITAKSSSMKIVAMRSRMAESSKKITVVTKMETTMI